MLIGGKNRYYRYYFLFEKRIFLQLIPLFIHIYTTRKISITSFSNSDPPTYDPDYYDRRGLRGEISVVASLSGETPRDVLYRTQKYWP